MFEILSTCRGGGYKYCRTYPKHPLANKKGLYPLHRVLMENKIGKLIEKGYIVHHKDGNKENNDISNLELLKNSEHTRMHKNIVEDIECNCAYCSKNFSLKPSIYRRKLSVSICKKLFCSISCASKYYWVQHS